MLTTYLLTYLLIADGDKTRRCKTVNDKTADGERCAMNVWMNDVHTEHETSEVSGQLCIAQQHGTYWMISVTLADQTHPLITHH